MVPVMRTGVVATDTLTLMFSWNTNPVGAVCVVAVGSDELFGMPSRRTAGLLGLNDAARPSIGDKPSIEEIER